jgi:hypothetical protein
VRTIAIELQLNKQVAHSGAHPKKLFIKHRPQSIQHLPNDLSGCFLNQRRTTRLPTKRFDLMRMNGAVYVAGARRH